MLGRSYLDLPVIQNERTVAEFVRGAPANIALKYKNAAGFSALIRRRLRALARTEWPDFDAFARALNLMPSTLRRRLEDESQSIQSIKDEPRRDVAIDYLSRTSKSVMDIASELRFAEASAFHRAFKNWTGAGPGEYRQRLHRNEEVSRPQSQQAARLQVQQRSCHDAFDSRKPSTMATCSFLPSGVTPMMTSRHWLSAPLLLTPA
jgi:AraC-like DNA-binding protein